MRFASLTIALLLATPVALAGPQPSLLFLADAGSSLDDGNLSAQYPQANESQMRWIAPAIDGPDVWFVSPQYDADRLRGPLFVGLWTDASFVASGNLSAWVFVRADGEDILVANGSRSLSVDPSQVPDPASIVPPDPADPEGAVLYAASLFAPLIMRPPMLLDLGMLDMELPANASIVLGLGLVAEDGSQLPLGAGLVRLSYGSTTSPSFVYAPWYLDDPVMAPVPSPTMSPSPSPSADPSPSATAQPGPTTEPGKDSPGLGIAAILALVAAALLVRRRV